MERLLVLASVVLGATSILLAGWAARTFVALDVRGALDELSGRCRARGLARSLAARQTGAAAAPMDGEIAGAVEENDAHKLQDELLTRLAAEPVDVALATCDLEGMGR